jgi:hypothetical protein
MTEPGGQEVGPQPQYSGNQEKKGREQEYLNWNTASRKGLPTRQDGGDRIQENKCDEEGEQSNDGVPFPGHLNLLHHPLPYAGHSVIKP